MKTIFLRVLDAEDKAAALREAIRNPVSALGQGRFEVDPAAFATVPRSPFAYWVSDRLRRLFSELPPFEGEGRTAKIGASTKNNFRFLRMGWETPFKTPGNIRNTVWLPFAKGGGASPYYADVCLVVNWTEEAKEIEAELLSKFPYLGDSAEFVLHRTHPHLSAGITWPLRGSRFSPQFLAAGCVFSDRGYAAFVPTKDLSACVATFNSKVFDYLFKIALGRHGFPEFIVGILQSLPWASASTSTNRSLSMIARRAWSLKRSLDTSTETSHAYILPPLLQVEASTLGERATAWAERVRSSASELSAIQAEIDEQCFDLYGIVDDDRRSITEGFGEGPTTAAISLDEGEGDPSDPEVAVEDQESTADVAGLTTELLSWAVGVAFGRFDLRLATGERLAPPEPEPFDPFPVCSPGMLTGVDGLPVVDSLVRYPITFPHDGILVDDEGHDRDLLDRAQQVFRVIFSGNADALWHEAAELLDPRGRDLRAWLARSFFDEHLKRYSRNRRRAPIFWQLATPSASYSIWVYCHRTTRDTFFHVLNDQVDPKVRHGEEKLTHIQQEAGPNPSAGQRRALAEQESFVEELRGLRQEVARVAPLWNPDLNDGVIINFSLLWRLVPQHRVWQRECRECWEKLVAGNYDWAHLAMHLWPERVVPKCADDRSLAISHGLEDEFWEEADGKWRKRQVNSARVNELVKERMSPAVKTALADLLAAPAAGSVSSRGRIPRRAVATQRPEPAQPKLSTIERQPKEAPARRMELASMDETILAKVRDAIAHVASGASKGDVLAATGLSDAEWHRAVSALVDKGEVNRTGEKRGTRYHLADRKRG